MAHASVTVPEAQKRNLVATPGSSSGLFDQTLLAHVVSSVKDSAVVTMLQSRSGARPRSAGSFQPQAGPSGFRQRRGGGSAGKRSASSSRKGGNKRFKGGKGGAPSSGPSGFRK